MSPARDRLSLEVLGGTGASAELPARGRMVIGCDPRRADLVLEGQGVDSVHCAVGRLKGGGWALKDLGSQFGTFLNGERVDSARLSAGDQLLIGSRRLRVFDPRHPAPAEPVAPARVDPAAAPARPRDSVPAVDDAATLPCIRGYEVRRLLGRGATGEVYLAEQQSLSRKVALKILSGRLEADPVFVKRFQAEARAAAALNHPNIVTVHDVGEDGGRHYIAMEYMVHGCLESRVAELGPMGWREVLDVLAHAAAGLIFAEQRGIVHRDIKPANLMITEHGMTKIADLGLAAQVEQEELQGERGKVFGTPHFLAPELIRGGAPDARSDLYSLGATAYRLLTGRTPFEGAGAREILRAALTEEPRPPSSIVAGIPPSIDALVLDLLQKDPARRTASAADLQKAIERLRHGAPVSGGERAGPRRGRRLVVLAVLLLGCAAAFAIFGRGTPEEGDGGLAGSSDPGSRPAGGTTHDPGGAPGEGGRDAGDPEASAAADAASELAFELREREANLAYRELASIVLEEQERILRLRELAVRFDGTDTATRAAREADDMERRRRTAAAAASALAGRREAVLSALRSAAGLGSDAPDPRAALERMRAVPDQAELEQDAEFVSARAALSERVLEEAIAFGHASLERAEALAAAGDFAQYRSLLERFTRGAALPALPDGEASERASELSALRARAEQSLAQIPTLQARHREQAARADRRTIARGLSGPGRLQADLGRQDFAAAVGRLRAVSEQLASADARAILERWIEQFEAAHVLLASFGRAHSQWRRTTVYDPRDGRGSPIEAVGGDERGLFLDDRGDVVHVPWSAWGGRAAELDKLFSKRLTRDWSPTELAGIEVLLRTAAVVEMLAVAGEFFTGDERAQLAERESRQILDNFDLARSWGFPPEVASRSERERAAAALLVSVCEAAGERAYSRGIGHLERLLEEYGDSMLVLLRSSGDEWREPDSTPGAARASAPGASLPPADPAQPPSTAAGQDGARDTEDDGG